MVTVYQSIIVARIRKPLHIHFLLVVHFPYRPRSQLNCFRFRTGHSMLRKFLLNFCLLPQDFGRMNLFAENILVISRCNVIMTSQWRHKQWLTFMRTAGESNSTTFPFSRMTILSLWIIVFSLWAIVRTVDSLNSSVICFLVEFSFWQIRRSGQLNEKFQPPGNCSKRIRSCINASVFKSTFAVASSINKILLFLRIARPFQSHQYLKNLRIVVKT